MSTYTGAACDSGAARVLRPDSGAAALDVGGVVALGVGMSVTVGIGIVAAPGAAGESDGAEGAMGSTQKPVDPKAGAGRIHIAAFRDMDAALPILFELACGIFLLVILEVRT